MVSGALSVLSLEDEAGAWLKCIRLRSETDEQNSTTLRESKKRQQDDSTAPENVTGCGTSTNASYPGANCLILYQGITNLNKRGLAQSNRQKIRPTLCLPQKRPYVNDDS